MRTRTRISYDYAYCSNWFSIIEIQLRATWTIVSWVLSVILSTWTARLSHLRGGCLTVPASDHAQSKSELNCSLRVWLNYQRDRDWTWHYLQHDILPKFACIGVSNRLLNSIRMTIMTHNWLPVCAWLACREKWLDIDATYRLFTWLFNIFISVYVRRLNLLLRGLFKKYLCFTSINIPILSLFFFILTYALKSVFWKTVLL